MATTELHTYVDAVDWLMDQFGSDSTDGRTLRKMKRAVENAYRMIAAVRNWANYYQRQIFTVSAYYNTGTVAYDHTGGTYERMLTLTSGTWPTWARYGVVRISGIDYEVEDYKSSTIITLSVNNNPGADVAASTSYSIYRDTYPLPADFKSIGTIRDVQRQLYPVWVKPDDFIAFRTAYQTMTQPRYYTILADQNYMGQMALKLYPPPDQGYTYEFMYYRQPRTLQTYQLNTGTATTVSTALTMSSSVLTANHVNSVIRFGSNTTAVTGTTGSNPYVEQRVIIGYTNATTAVLDQALSSDATAVAYEISDPIDIEAPAMYTAFMRRCEWEFAMIMNRDDPEKYMKNYMIAETLAMEADSRYFAERPTGTRVNRRIPETWTTRNAT